MSNRLWAKRLRWWLLGGLGTAGLIGYDGWEWGALLRYYRRRRKQGSVG